jgi:hypothetical protein
MSVQVSARVPEELNSRIEAFSDENDCTKSEAVRTLLEEGLETSTLRTENRRLKEQLAATNQRIDEANEVVEYVREEQQLQRERRDLERLRAEANILQRWKWKLTGIPAENAEGAE